MACRLALLSALALLAGGDVQAQTAASSAIAPPPSPLLQPLAPGAPQFAPPVVTTPAPVIEPSRDVSDQFRAEVSAIVGSGSTIRVLLSRSEDYGRASRSLRVGDVYQDGWKIVSLTPKAVRLARGAETRLVDLTVAGRVALAANAAKAAQGGQQAVITMGPLGLAPPPPPAAPASEEAAAAPAQGVDPAAVAAVLQALVVLGSQPQ